VSRAAKEAQHRWSKSGMSAEPLSSILINPALQRGDLTSFGVSPIPISPMILGHSHFFRQFEHSAQAAKKDSRIKILKLIYRRNS
jgi:hypothetical protein